MPRSTLGVDWKHERAISDWEAERSHDPERGPLEHYRSFRSRFIRAKVFQELDGLTPHKKLYVSAILPLRECDAPTLPEESDQRLQLIRGVLGELTPVMQTILTLSLEGRSAVSIAKEIGYSEQWVGQLRQRAMRQVREALVRAKVVKRIRPYTSREML